MLISPDVTQFPCPDPEILQKLLREDLSESMTQAVEDHISSCPDCQQLLQSLIGSLPDTLALPTWQHSMEEEPPILPGYTLIDRIDSGGMGVIWRICDLEFHRVLAIKVMKAGMDKNRKAVRRFHTEVQITGQLAHPSIVPVYARGRLPDGRLYYTMKLVQGKTLATILNQRPNPTAQLAELLRIFVHVCQAMGYAHSCGVIHRDLKPANVMVGAFGEVQLMDWGLAKILAEKDTIEVDTAATDTIPGKSGPSLSAGSEPNQETQRGDVFGTLSYMPPEQAHGDVELLDSRCDVFSLGAILCEILTGDPPYRGQTREELLRQAMHGELTDAFTRLDASGAHPDLIELTKSCLAPMREDRRADAEAIAEAILAYQASIEERLRQEGVERAKAQVRELEERKRRRLANSLTGVVCVGLILLIIGTLVLGRTNQELATANTDLEQARTVAIQKRERASWARDHALRALDRMTSSVTGESLETQPAITAEQKKFLAEVLKDYQELAQEEVDDERSLQRRASAAYRLGLIHYRLGFHELGLRAFQQAQAEYEQLGSQFSDETQHRVDVANTWNNLGLLYHELGKFQASETAFRQALTLREELVKQFPNERKYQRVLAGSHSNLGLLLQGFPDRQAEVQEHYQRAFIIREQLVERFPTSREHRQDLAASHSNLGSLFSAYNQLPEAEQSGRKALAIREKLAEEFPHLAECRQDLADSYFNIAGVLRKRDHPAQSEEFYRKALAIREKLAADYPTVPKYRQDLAGSYQNLSLLLEAVHQRPEEEIKAAHQAMSIRKKLAVDYSNVPEYQRDLAGSHLTWGSILTKMKKWSEAEKTYQQALAVQAKLLAESQDQVTQRDYAGTYNNLGRLYTAQKKWADAEKAYQQAISLREQLAGQKGATPQLQHELAVGYFNLADMLENVPSRFSDTVQFYRKAEGIWDKLLEQFPTNREYQQNLAATYNNLGVLFRQQNQLVEAKEAYRNAVAVFETLTRDFPKELESKYAAALVNLAGLLRENGKATSEAITSFDRAIQILEPIVQADPQRKEERHALMIAHWRRALALDERGQPTEATTSWEKALDLAPAQNKTTIRISRAHGRVCNGQLEPALTEAAELVKLNEADANMFYNLACLYAVAAQKDSIQQDEHVQTALHMLQKAVERGYKNAERLKNDEDFKALQDHPEFRKIVQRLK